MLAVVLSCRCLESASPVQVSYYHFEVSYNERKYVCYNLICFYHFDKSILCYTTFWHQIVSEQNRQRPDSPAQRNEGPCSTSWLTVSDSSVKAATGS